MQHFGSTSAFVPLTLLSPTSFLFPVHLHHPLMFQTVFLYILPPLSAVTLSGFFNGMLAVSEPEALNYFTSSRLILLTLYVFRNLALTHLSLFGSKGSPLCNVIALTPGQAFFLPMTCMLAAASALLLGTAYPSPNFLPPLFLRLTPTLIM